jgi:hypothetical protein
MPLPREHNIKQLKKIRKMMKGQDIGDKVMSDQKVKKYPNLMYSDNPLDRKVDTYESFIKKQREDNKTIKEGYNEYSDDALVIWENYLLENEDFINDHYMEPDVIIADILDKYSYKEGIMGMVDEIESLLSNYLDMEVVQESSIGMVAYGGSLFTNNKKQTITSSIGTNLLQIGKYVKVGDIEGYIDYVDEHNVYVSRLQGVGEPEKIPFKKFLKELEKEEEITENSGLPSEFWTVSSVNESEDLPYYDDDNEDIDDEEIENGTEDDPLGVNKQKLTENIYVDTDKMITCNECGQQVVDSYIPKMNHIYTKHFEHPKMDGSVPSKTYLPSDTLPQGGKHDEYLLKKYFGK